jgi:hypothetical protein
MNIVVITPVTTVGIPKTFDIVNRYRFIKVKTTFIIAIPVFHSDLTAKMPNEIKGESDSKAVFQALAIVFVLFMLDSIVLMLMVVPTISDEVLL